MPNLQASPRSDLLGFIADKLKAGKSFGNKYEILKQIPLLGGTGLGDLFLGNSPELADDMSYNLSSAIRGGNRATGGLGTYTLDKRSADLGMTLADALGIGTGIAKLGGKGLNTLLNKSGFDATRRAFLEGKASGLNQPTNEAITSTLSTGNDILQTPVSRRNVLKGAVLAGGAVAAPSLLKNFSKEVEHTVPKVVEHSIDNIVNSGIKHKYSTLSDYFKDVLDRAHISTYDIMDPPGTHSHPELDPIGYKEDVDLWTKTKSDFIKQHLLDDEELYTIGKKIKDKGINYTSDGIAVNRNGIKINDDILNSLDQFSPKAKQEMKNWKSGVEKLNSDFGSINGSINNDWKEWMANVTDNPNETLQFLQNYIKPSDFP